MCRAGTARRQWRDEVDARRLVAGVREPAAVPVPAVALVLPPVHLGALPWQVSRIRLNCPGAPRPPRGARLSLAGASRLRALPVRTGNRAGRNDRRRIFFGGASRSSSRSKSPRGRPDGVRDTRAAVVFSPQLEAAGRRGRPSMGRWPAVCARVRAQMAARRGTADEPLIGSADIQSLADMGNSFAIVEGMSGAVHQEDGAAPGRNLAAPVVPLVLTMIPLGELLDRIFEDRFLTSPASALPKGMEKNRNQPQTHRRRRVGCTEAPSANRFGGAGRRTCDGKETSLKEHGIWRPALRRHDPIDLLIADSKGRTESLFPIRFGRMVRSPFTFCRGSASAWQPTCH